MKHRGIVICCLIFPAAIAFSAARPQEKMDALMVYGNKFIFGIVEPENWTGDTENASRFHANVILYPKGKTWNSPVGIIRVRINEKADENTAKDLAFDMEEYRKKFPQVQFQDFEVTHPNYTCFPKIFFVESEFYEYVTYVNPGESFWYTFSVALNTQKAPAGEGELAAYRKVVASLLAFPGSVEAAAPSEENAFEFDQALKTAEGNMKSSEGKRYDESFGKNLAPSLARTMMTCTKDIPESAEIEPFVILVRVGLSGEAEKILVRPETQVALCIKPAIPSSGHPKPPGPSWWVKVDVIVKVKDKQVSGRAEPSRAFIDYRYSHRYSYWSEFVPGTSVCYRYSCKTANHFEEIKRTFTLKEVTSECVRLECTDSPISGEPSKTSDAALATLEYPAAGDEFHGWDLLGVRLGYGVFQALRNPAARILEEGREELSIQGTPVATIRKTITFETSPSTTTLAVWLSEDIPGRVVKFVREVKGNEDVRDEAVALEYRSIRAEKAEIDRLRSSRKPTLIDVPAWTYAAVRLGLVDEYGVGFRDFREARNEATAVFLKDIQTNPAYLRKTLSPMRDKLKELASNLNQNIRSAEIEIGAAEYEKLRPVTKLAGRITSLLVKEVELLIDTGGAITGRHSDPRYLASLTDRLNKVREEIKAVGGEFQEEWKKLDGVQIKFTG